MKRTPTRNALIIGLAFVCALVIVAIPAAVGQLVARWGPKVVAEWSPEAETRIQAGWFRSHASVAFPDGSRLETRVRHLPLLKPGWIALDGMVQIEGMGQPAAVQGHLSFMGNGTLHAQHPGLDLEGDPRTRLDDWQLSYRSRPGEQRASLQASSLEMTDQRGNTLVLEDWNTELQWKPDTVLIDLQLHTTGRRPEAGPSTLSVQAENVHLESVGLMLDSWNQVTDTEPGSRNHQMGQLGMLNAWQELQNHGLTLVLEEVRLDDRFRVGGRWDTRDRRIQGQFSGGGSETTLGNWIGPLAGMTMGLPPEDGRRFAIELLDTLVDEGWVTRTGDQVEIDYPGPAASFPDPGP